MKAPLLLALAVLLSFTAPAPTAPGELPASEPFGSIWYDGRAELSGYRWKGTRYGELRTGQAVAVFVTEPFSRSLRVKVDRPDPDAGEVVTAMKLNLVRDFRTGIYDYNTMVSAFVDSEDFSTMKLTFTSAEWCGHVYEELDVREEETTVDVRSYFQGESERHRLAPRPDGLYGEQLLVWLRGLRGPVLEPGASLTVPFLPSAFERRLRHVPPTWAEARITRDAANRRVTVPAGTFEAVVYRVESSDGRSAEVAIEAASPHRLLSWSWERDGTVLDAGALSGTKRMPYWQLHVSGDERHLEELGL
jgi:hypothetical protein